MIRLDNFRLHLASVLLVAVLLHACSDGGGDGGGIGGSGITPILNADLSYGTIAGFGSVVINGERFNTDQSEFLINGINGSQADLAVGMLVSAEVNFAQMTASQVSFEPTVLGPLSAIDPVTSRLTVLGQTVVISADTVLDGVTLAGLSRGDYVQLTGNRTAAGTLRATWISLAASTDRLQVTGNIENLQANDRRFSIGQLTIDYASADLTSLNNNAEDELDNVSSNNSMDNLVNGLPVIVSAPSSGLDTTGGRLSAASIVPSALAQLDSGLRIDVEGIVGAVLSTDRFTLDGRAVSVGSNTVIQLVGGSPASLAAVNRNTRIEVEGLVNAAGAIDATRIIVIPSDESRLTGRVENLDAGNQTLSVLGIDVATTSRTRFDVQDDRSGSTGFASLGVGSYVEVDASFIDNRLVAARIKLEDPDEEASLRGPVTSIDVNASSVEVLNVPLLDSSGTKYENRAGQEVSRAAFLQSLQVGDLVEAKWKEFQSTALPPDSVEIEVED